MIYYAVEHYILIGVYTFLFVLVLVNFWNIIIGQKRYKSWPLMAFYIFAFLAILFRLVVSIWCWVDSIVFSVIATV